jgi:WD40 repeat protein
MIRVWDPATEKELRRHQVPLVKVRCFSRNGAWALFGGEDDPVGIWDLRAGREMLKIEATSSVWSVALSPDTGRLALGHADGTVALWNTSEKKEVARLRSDMSGITAVAFSSDGRSLAWGDNLGAVCMAEGREGREPLRFKARAWPAIRELIFSPDGKTLVATDHVGTSRAYSEPGIEPGDPQEVLRHLPEGNWAGFRSDPRWAASGFLQKNPAGREVLSADGRFVAGVTPDGRLVIWEAPGGK